jgi:hypothetical protein
VSGISGTKHFFEYRNIWGPEKSIHFGFSDFVNTMSWYQSTRWAAGGVWGDKKLEEKNNLGG